MIVVVIVKKNIQDEKIIAKIKAGREKNNQ